MKVKFWAYISNNGDGSPGFSCYKTAEAAENAAADDNERFCEDVFEVILDVDPETGELLKENEP